MEFISGNEAVVRGALRAGCDYFAGYPITPANAILELMLSELPARGGVAVQTEDEIAAIGQCIGAALAGATAMTATSGPGLSLFSESIGLAQMTEAPLVVVDCQRMGPATGGATSTGEGDVMFARYASPGGYPLPVYAAADAASAYRLTFESFGLARMLRSPVIVLLSKDIAMTRQTVDLERVELPRPARGVRRPRGGDHRPYDLSASPAPPAFAPIGGSRLVRVNGSIHDEWGLITSDRTAIARRLAHLRDKIIARADDLERVEWDPCPGARELIVSYGVTDGAAREAVEELRRAGRPVAHLTLYSLWPVAQRALKRALADGVERLIVPELNIGLYADELRKHANGVHVESLTRIDGGLIEPEQVIACVTRAKSTDELSARSVPCPS